MEITRIGIGYDVHRVEKCDNGFISICGIKLPCEYKVLAHSDGDVGLHAITEALLGSIAEGNIGTHFPPSDPKWKNVESRIFVEHAASIIKKKGGQIINIDVTIICEKPRIMIHSSEMRKSIAQMLGIRENFVSVKATTTEKMGFIGREEGIAAEAVCAILMKAESF